MGYPIVDPDPWPVYAGDDLTPTEFVFRTDGLVRDLVAEGWTGWAAQWRSRPNSDVAVDLDVDVSEANVGKITVSAGPLVTAAMSASGVWDVQATRGAEVLTFVKGRTLFERDVTRV